MQNPQPSASARFLVLSPAGMAVALAALAFLRGLFGFAFGFVHHRTAPMGGPGLGSPGMGGAMQPHHFAHSVFAFPLHWLAGIINAGLAGAHFAMIYNAVAQRAQRNRDANTTAPA
jgi:hypothetical protein